MTDPGLIIQNKKAPHNKHRLIAHIIIIIADRSACAKDRKLSRDIYKKNIVIYLLHNE